jgi:hypothetical protein
MFFCQKQPLYCYYHEMTINPLVIQYHSEL